MMNAKVVRDKSMKTIKAKQIMAKICSICVLLPPIHLIGSVDSNSEYNSEEGNLHVYGVESTVISKLLTQTLNF